VGKGFDQPLAASGCMGAVPSPRFLGVGVVHMDSPVRPSVWRSRPIQWKDFMSTESGLSGTGRARRPRLEQILYEVCRRVCRASHVTSGRPICHLVLYPPFPNKASLADILNRLSWGLSSRPPEDVRVDVPCPFAEEMAKNGPSRLLAPESHEDYLLRESFLSQCRWVEAKRAGEALAQADLLLVRDARALRQAAVLARADQTLVMDPSYFHDVEAANVATLLSRLLGPRACTEAKALSASRYDALLRRFEGVEDAYVFFTGPSLEAGLARPLIEGSARLICNWSCPGKVDSKGLPDHAARPCVIS
jgi:hypothetical protein